MQKLGDKKIEITHRSGQNVSEPLTVKKKSTFLGLFVGPRTEALGKSGVLKSTPPNLPRANLIAVRNWVALEEKIVHDYKEQKTVFLKSAVPLPKSPAKQPLPTGEAFTTQTAVLLPPSVSKPQAPLRGSKKVFSGVARFLLACACLAAGTFILAHVQETFLRHEAAQKLVQLENEKIQMGQSYAALARASEDQAAKVKGLNSRLHDVTLKWKAAQSNKAAYEQGLEKKYRGELMRITIRYESELATLRDTVRAQNATVNALTAQIRIFEKIVGQVGMSALSGAAAGLPQGSLSADGTSTLHGKITSVNGRQGFVVIDLGSEQGVRANRWITVSRNGARLAAGRIDRVYPTMSVAVIRDEGMLQAIQEGDSVLFSN